MNRGGDVGIQKDHTAIKHGTKQKHFCKHTFMYLKNRYSDLH